MSCLFLSHGLCLSNPLCMRGSFSCPLSDWLHILVLGRVSRCMLSHFSCVWLCPWDSPGKNSGVSFMPSSKGSSWPRDGTWFSCTGGRFLTAEPPGKPQPFSLPLLLITRPCFYQWYLGSWFANLLPFSSTKKLYQKRFQYCIPWV